MRVIDLRVELKADETLNFLGALERQIPYATSVAINRTLDDAQKAIRVHLREAFHLRRPDFIDRTVYIGRDDRARKDNLVGTVRIDPRRDVLAKFEDDTIKRPRSAKNLAVPVFRETDKDMVVGRSNPLNFKRLMAAIDKGGARGFGAGTMGEIKRRRQKGMHGPMQRELVFLVKVPKGRFLVQRIGAKQTRVLYSFTPSVPITPELNFKRIAFETAQAVWNARAAEAIDLAIQTAR